MQQQQEEATPANGTSTEGSEPQWWNRVQGTSLGNGMNNEGVETSSALQQAEQAQSTQRNGKQWIFRDPAADDPFEVALQYKVMALSNVSNTEQTFTMTIMEDVAVWLTENEFEEFCQCPYKRNYQPRNFIDTYVYKSTETEWYEPYRAFEGCQYHIRDVFEDNRQYYRHVAMKML